MILLGIQQFSKSVSKKEKGTFEIPHDPIDLSYQN